VGELREVHERQFHLFIVSHDMTFFEHIHPEMLKPVHGCIPYDTWHDAGCLSILMDRFLLRPGRHAADPSRRHLYRGYPAFYRILRMRRAQLTPDADAGEAGNRYACASRLFQPGYISGFKQSRDLRSLNRRKTGDRSRSGAIPGRCQM